MAIQPVERIALYNTLVKAGAQTDPVWVSDLTSKPKVGTIALKNEGYIIESVLDDLIDYGVVMRVPEGYLLTGKDLDEVL